MSVSPRLNLELKARDSDPERSLRAATALGAEDRGTLWQRDTYFAVPSGRLKLREQRPGATELIRYDRPDDAGERPSRFTVVEVEDAEGLRAALSAQFGVRAVVEKERHLLLHRNLRIHLDRVEGLGTFVELEAMADPQGDDLDAEAAALAELREALAIDAATLVAGSYAELIAPPAQPGSASFEPLGPLPPPLSSVPPLTRPLGPLPASLPARASGSAPPPAAPAPAPPAAAPPPSPPRPSAPTPLAPAPPPPAPAAPTPAAPTPAAPAAEPDAPPQPFTPPAPPTSAPPRAPRPKRRRGGLLGWLR
jgi:adenylate cyclase, class 2